MTLQLFRPNLYLKNTPPQTTDWILFPTTLRTLTNEDPIMNHKTSVSDHEILKSKCVCSLTISELNYKLIVGTYLENPPIVEE